MIGISTRVVAIVLLLLPTGCLVRDLNVRHYEDYYRGGLTAFSESDFQTAKKRFDRAYWYAQTGHLGPKAEAAALYNYALATGHLGDFAQAEDCLKKTLALDEKPEGPKGAYASSRYFELARLYQGWGKDEMSVEAYEKAFSLLKKNQYEDDPIGAAIALSDYAKVLRKTGHSDKADAKMAEADTLRKAHSGESPKVTFRYYP